ncbi:hypothetical protein [Burkholderia sp. S171]|uniref:hypothetical protein n=1 Tax=Burkholderia sp. S171 TaxID=1641860 RepID=UPI00131D4DD2|nr:hypothetical protein [Burkholderia sp. S171]
MRRHSDDPASPTAWTESDQFIAARFSLRRHPAGWLWAIAITTGLSFVLLLWHFFLPRWETNDDVAMAMIAHGYGIATHGSPNLVFSNVLWGRFVRLLPEINGVQGYSIATMLVLVTVGATLIYCLAYRFTFVASLFALILVLTRPTLFPQFTINAGLLALAAVLCWQRYIQQARLSLLTAGYALAFCSFLVRYQETLLIFAIAVPLFPWKCRLPRMPAQVALIAFLIAISAASFVDREAYRSNDWSAFNELNPARIPFTDYGAAVRMKLQPHILEDHEYSSNDVDLISTWFFVDPKIANPQSLNKMVGQLSERASIGRSLAGAKVAMAALWQPEIAVLFAAALLLLLIRPDWPLLTSWCLCLIAIFCMGFLGRPGVTRVYVPMLCLLLVFALPSRENKRWRYVLSFAILAGSALLNLSQVCSDSRVSEAITKSLEPGLAELPREPVVIWGGVFPFEFIYPVTERLAADRPYRFYALGVFTLAPYTVAYNEALSGRGLVDRLVSDRGVAIVGNMQRLTYLDIYCREHLHGKLEQLSTQTAASVTLTQMRCRKNQ